MRYPIGDRHTKMTDRPKMAPRLDRRSNCRDKNLRANGMAPRTPAPICQGVATIFPIYYAVLPKWNHVPRRFSVANLNGTFRNTRASSATICSAAAINRYMYHCGNRAYGRNIDGVAQLFDLISLLCPALLPLRSIP